MDLNRHREHIKLLPLNRLSQPYLESPSKQRHRSNAAIPNVMRRQSIDKDFEMVLKKSHHPYTSKLSVGRRRFTSTKRPDRNDRPQGSEDLNFKTEGNNGSLSQSKDKIRYRTKLSQDNSHDNTKRFFHRAQPSSESKQKPSSVKNVALNNRSYFLKKLKERYGNKFIRHDIDKHQLKSSSEKVTLLHHNSGPSDVFEDDQGIQTMILTDNPKYITPQMVIRKYGSRMRTYERQVEIHQHKEIYYFTEDCIVEHQPPKESDTFEADELIYDDKDGGYLWRQKNHIAYRYQITGMLGEGSFGQVFKCIDHKQDEEVAVKIVRNRQKYSKQAQIEIDILNYVKANDPNMNKNLVEVKENFTWRQHTCIVFELLSINLYELIKMNDYYGLPLDLIRRFSLQLLNGMHFLHKNEIIHADLKPENILLKQPNKSGLKIIDFGSSCFIKNRIYTYIQSRYYRAPEVILGIPYDFKIDIWSFACIIAELYIGYPLFPGQNEKEQMWLIMETIGVPPRNILEDSTRRHHYFEQTFKPLVYEKSNGKQYMAMTNTLEQIIDPKDKSFCRFLESCFVWDANQRPTALECLKQQWILEGLPEDIRQQHFRFIEQEQNLIRLQRRKRSPPARQIKMNESPPARARPAYFDRSRQRQRFRVQGAKPVAAKTFQSIEGIRTRNRS